MSRSRPWPREAHGRSVRTAGVRRNLAPAVQRLLLSCLNLPEIGPFHRLQLRLYGLTDQRLVIPIVIVERCDGLGKCLDHRPDRALGDVADRALLLPTLWVQ